MDAFCFRSVFNTLPAYVTENVVREWCEPLGAIRYIAATGNKNNIYVDVKEWLPAGFEMRDKLIALRAKGKFDKAEIPTHPLKFGRYLLVLPSYTLRQHEEYLLEKEKQATAWRQAQQTIHTIPFYDGPIAWVPPEVVRDCFANEEPLEFVESDGGTTASASSADSLRGYMTGIEFE